MSDWGAHPGRPSGPPPGTQGPPGTPAAPPPGWGTPPPQGGGWGGTPPTPPGGGGFGGAAGASGASRAPWIIAAVAVVVVVALGVGAFIVFGGDDEASAGEIFLEPASAPGDDPFATGLEGQALPVTTTTLAEATTTTAGGDAAPAPTPSVSGSRPGLYGGTRDVATCDPAQQADFLERNDPIAQAFVDALNADPTLRWSGGARVTVSQIRSYLLELTPVTLTADTRVTNHGYRNGRPTARQAVLQAGTAVLVDAYGVPRVKCNCGNPLAAPAPVRATPTYTGPRWTGFSPTTVVVITEVTIQIDVYVLVDVETGEPFSRPAGTTGADDTDAEVDSGPPATDPPATDPPATDPPATDGPATVPAPRPDQAAFCSGWQSALEQYGDIDPSVPEVLRIFEELTAVAPPEVRPPMEVLLQLVRDAAASGAEDIEAEDEAALGAILAVTSYLEGTCGLVLD